MNGLIIPVYIQAKHINVWTINQSCDDHGDDLGDPADDLRDLPGDNPGDDLEDLLPPQQDHVEPGIPDPEAEVPSNESIYDQVIITT